MQWWQVEHNWRFRVYIWDQWWHIIAAQMEVKPEPKKEELKTTLDTKSENQSVF